MALLKEELLIDAEHMTGTGRCQQMSLIGQLPCPRSIAMESYGVNGVGSTTALGPEECPASAQVASAQVDTLSEAVSVRRGVVWCVAWVSGFVRTSRGAQHFSS